MTAPLQPLPLGPQRLTQETAQLVGAQSSLRTGVVSAVTTRGLDVVVAGGTVPAAHLASYTPAIGDVVALMQTQDSWVVLDRIVGAGTPTDSLSPGGAVGTALLDVMQTDGTPNPLASSSGALVTVPDYSVSFFHPVNHSVMVIAGFGWFGSTSADWIAAGIYDNASGAQVAFFGEPASGGLFSRFGVAWGMAGGGFGGVSRTYVLKMQRSSGAGTISIANSTTPRGFMLALDMGDNGSIVRTV